MSGLFVGLLALSWQPMGLMDLEIVSVVHDLMLKADHSPRLHCWTVVHHCCGTGSGSNSDLLGLSSQNYQALYQCCTTIAAQALQAVPSFHIIDSSND